jgi:deazaflavin-dependent oxidoreductase (nitroreductase family)
MTLSGEDKRSRVRAKRLWRVMNPLARPLAGWVPWWVVLETTGRKSGKSRRTPLARGPRDGDVLWLIAVHGSHADYVRNLLADPRIRIKVGGRWHTGRASIVPLDERHLKRFNAYARGGPGTFGIDPMLVKVELSPWQAV